MISHYAYLLTDYVSQATVNSDNFAKFYFRETSHLRSFAKIKHCKIMVKSLSFTDVGKPGSSREFLMSQICLLMLFLENEVLANCFEFIYCLQNWASTRDNLTSGPTQLPRLATILKLCHYQVQIYSSR